jgi:hypothetical protein
MRILALLTVVLMVDGCATTTGKAAGTIAALGGTAVVIDVAATQGHDPNETIEHSAPQLYVTGVLLLGTLIAAGVALAAEASAPDAAAPVDDAPQPAVVVASAPIDASACDPRAAQLTRQARLAAQLGQCTAVSSFGDRVSAIDRRCYAGVFVTDAAIGRCSDREREP